MKMPEVSRLINWWTYFFYTLYIEKQYWNEFLQLLWKEQFGTFGAVCFSEIYYIWKISWVSNFYNKKAYVCITKYMMSCPVTVCCFCWGQGHDRCRADVLPTRRTSK